MRSKKPKAVEMVKWLTQKGVEKVLSRSRRTCTYFDTLYHEEGTRDLLDASYLLLSRSNEDDLHAWEVVCELAIKPVLQAKLSPLFL